MKRLLVAALTVLVFGCTEENIVDPVEVVGFLNEQAIISTGRQIETDIQFWERQLAKDKDNFIYQSELASAHLSYFKHTGGISHLATAEALQIAASARLNDKDPKLLQSLAQLSITTHQFRNAANYNEKAAGLNASPVLYGLLSFDAAMEVGDYTRAAKDLEDIKNKKSFQYLIRKAKWLDHQGDIDAAIAQMEQALDVVKPRNNSSLFCWTLSNLGDMYGHAGRIKEAYGAYRSVLTKEPGYLHALKGIAWIAYSHDNDPVLAEQLTAFIMKYNEAPEHHLVLAEILKAKGDHVAAKDHEDQFLQLCSDVRYGGMYNKYLIRLFCDRSETLKAIQLAGIEVEARPTPETYSWLAWSYFRAGEIHKAVQLYTNEVMGKTSEPESLLAGAYILKAAGLSGKSEFNQCLDSRFELGPLAIRELKEYFRKG